MIVVLVGWINVHPSLVSARHRSGSRVRTVRARIDKDTLLMRARRCPRVSTVSGR